MPEPDTPFKTIVIGTSTGGVEALKVLLGALPEEFPLPILVVQHVSPDTAGALAHLLDQLCAIHVKEADEGELPAGGTVYLAPSNYHLLVEPDGRLGLSTDAAVAFARPSVDVLFETAAQALGKGLIGIVLTGGGYDGSLGLRRIKELGGIAIVQDPADATAASMPEHAMKAVTPDYVVTLAALPELIVTLARRSHHGRLP